MMFQMAHGADATSEAAGQMFNKMQYKPNYPICMHEGHYYNFASIRKLACTHKVAIQLISFLNFVSIKCYRSQLLADPQVGYTALMGVPPKVQPTFADINYTANKTLGYTALMGVPPEVQPTFADSNHTANKNWVTLHSWVCHLKCSLRLLTLIIQLTKHWVTLHSWVCHLKCSLRLLTLIIQLTKTGLHCTHGCAT